MRNVVRITGMLTILVALFAAQAPRQALAHTRAEIGPYVVVIGWQTEPVIAGERNALTLSVSEQGTAVTGVEGMLEITVRYGDRAFLGNLEPTETPGLYRAPIWPTVRGQYEVLLEGNIAGEAVSVVLEPEEVLTASVLQFPETPPDTAALEAQLTVIATEARTTRILSLAGLLAGAIGVVAGAFAMLRRGKTVPVDAGRSEMK